MFIRPALNLRAEEASAEAGLFTVRTALLGEPEDADVVLPTRPLGEMHGEAAGRALAAAGASLETGVRVDDLDALEADAVVVAVPPEDSARLLDEPAPELEHSPIVSVHLLFDRQLLQTPLAALLGSPAHWVFNRGLLTGTDPRYLTVVSARRARAGSPARPRARRPDRRRRHRAARRGGAGLVAGQPRAARHDRGPARQRSAAPGPATGRPNVVRAGAWTATGWPPTMEGAVRSGHVAARALVRAREEVVA